jgi:hypothetical protein
MEGDQELVFKDCPDNPLDYVKILVKSGELFQNIDSYVKFDYIESILE